MMPVSSSFPFFSCHWSYFITSLLTLASRMATKPAFHVLPSRLGNTGVASAPKRHLPPPLQADDRVSISALHPPRGYRQRDTHRYTYTNVYSTHTLCQVLAYPCLCACAERGNDQLSNSTLWAQKTCRIGGRGG